jgi:hypothetical protein
MNPWRNKNYIFSISHFYFFFSLYESAFLPYYFYTITKNMSRILESFQIFWLFLKDFILINIYKLWGMPQGFFYNKFDFASLY